MNEASNDSAPASVAENIDKIIRVENNALERRTGREAVTDAIGGFVGTVAFVVWQLVACVGWVVVNAGRIPGIKPFDPFPYPFLSSITSLEAVLLTAFVRIMMIMRPSPIPPLGCTPGRCCNPTVEAR